MSENVEQQTEKKAGGKKAGAKKAGGTKKAAKKASAESTPVAAKAPKERRFTQSDAVVAAIKRLTRKAESAPLSKVYDSVVANNGDLFGNAANPKSTIRCIVQRDRRIQRTEDGWAALPEGAEKKTVKATAKKAAAPAKGGAKKAGAKKGTAKAGADEVAAKKPRKARAAKAAKQALASAEGAAEPMVELDAEAIAEADLAGE